ncbi:methyltransferase domain-containing protein [Gordonia sp. VNQ95]|uniref:class I SAM-dependent methyltransferase n=1 Tax=Gordonia sp. VNQ95 TaxID=3156619 RepID=UPI0032B4DEA0
MKWCRGCGSWGLRRILDLGQVPAADDFPLAAAPVTAAETSHPLAMDRCAACGLAQLADDDTVTAEPRGVEPQALRDQAAAAVADVAAAGYLRGQTVREFGSPHGGTWLPLLAERGFVESDCADVVLDSLGIMHEPDQAAAFARRVASTAPDGVLLMHFHSFATIMREGQWNALRHGHFAYYSLRSMTTLLRVCGMSAVDAWRYDLYGGTVLVAARLGVHAPSETLRAIADYESAVLRGMDPTALQDAVDAHTAVLREWLEAARGAGESVYAYGAASRAVALFHRAGADTSLVAGVADASPGKRGRRMPGTDIPIISPEELIAAQPDRVLLTVPDLLDEVSTRYPELSGRWYVDGLDLNGTGVATAGGTRVSGDVREVQV